VGREALIAAGTRAENSFGILRLVMALAARRLLRRRMSPQANPLPITARLPATTLLASLPRPILPRCSPPRPDPRGCRAGFAAVSRKRMQGSEPFLASFEKTHPRPSPSRDLPLLSRAIMLETDQRERQLPNVKSRQRSLSLRSGAILRFLCPASCAAPTLQHSRRDTAHTPLSPSTPQSGSTTAAIRRRSLWPPGPAKLALSFTATDRLAVISDY
jgi:hypothetical protein